MYKKDVFPTLPLAIALGIFYYVLYYTDISKILYETAIDLADCRPDSDKVVFFNGLQYHGRFKIIGTFIKWPTLYVFISFRLIKFVIFLMLFLLIWQIFDFFIDR